MGIENYLSPDQDESSCKPLPGPPYFNNCLVGEINDKTFAKGSKFLKDKTPRDQQLGLGMIVGHSYKPKPKPPKRKIPPRKEKPEEPKSINLYDAVRLQHLETIRKSKERFQSRET